jgi:hypothetical protein
MRCMVPACPFDTEVMIVPTGEVPAVASEHLQLLAIHMQSVHVVAPMPPVQQAVAQPAAPPPPRTEKVPYPKLHMKDGSVSEEEWEYFTFAWGTYKGMAQVTVGTKDVLASMLGEVSNKIFSRLGEPGYRALTEVTLLAEARKIVVKHRNKLLNRLKLSTMNQGVMKVSPPSRQGSNR